MVELVTAPQPLILTLRIDDTSQHFFNELRKRHFPAKINYLDAHITLFHALPGQKQIIEEISAAAERTGVFTVIAEEVRPIGNGSVIKLNSPQLVELHGMLQKKWRPILSKQDKQKLWPHITIQNKVLPADAKSLQQQLSATFEAFTFNALGFHLWRYLNGPWEFINQFNFNNQKTMQ